MGIKRTEAVILRSLAYGETSKIITTLTRDSGKLSFMAKGARDIKSAFGGSLELLNHTQVVYYEKSGRDLQYLSEVSVIQPFFMLRDDPRRLLAGLSVAEFCDRSVHANEDTTQIFSLLVETLTRLNEPDKPVFNQIIFFLLALSDRLGFRPDFSRCRFEKDLLEHDEIFFDIKHGRFTCSSCAAQTPVDTSLPLSREGLSVARYLIKSRGAGSGNVVISDKARHDLMRILLRHLQYHVEELNNLNVIKFYDL